MAYNSGVNFIFLRNVTLKGIILFIILAFLVGFVPADTLGRISLYNHLVPGRPRLPFGETPQRSYNLSLFNLEAMFASHEISAENGTSGEYRIILLGDSSIWGTLLRPDETLAGRLNGKEIQICGKKARFYNLGYPTISLTKDVMILNRALQEKPDLVIWSTTLEAFPIDKQYASPLAENNRSLIQPILGNEAGSSVRETSFWENSLFGRRRELADWARLQLYGIPWAATGIDQDYPARFPAADIDLDADKLFHGFKPGDDLQSALAWDVLEKGMTLAQSNDLPILLVNEPILISNGENSDTRYNFYYPRWAYDAYRSDLAARVAVSGWHYVDAWDQIPMDQFTNSAIHITAKGEEQLSSLLIPEIANIDCK